VDSFWAADPTQNCDAYGRWTQDTGRFPEPLSQLADYVHANGQLLGLYLNPGIAVDAVKKNTPIYGTNCTANDIVVMPLTKGNT
jgi:alpha-glucosidase (family GH31 glycosyl hydrolase)